TSFFDERPAHSKKYRTHRIGCPFGKERSTLDVTSALARTLLTHSARNTIIGSTRLALRAGIQQASSAMPDKSKATHVKVIGSEVLTPYSRLFIMRAPPKAMSSPHNEP